MGWGSGGSGKTGGSLSANKVLLAPLEDEEDSRAAEVCAGAVVEAAITKRRTAGRAFRTGTSCLLAVKPKNAMRSLIQCSRAGSVAELEGTKMPSQS
jgi:hypothetical protein